MSILNWLLSFLIWKYHVDTHGFWIETASNKNYIGTRSMSLVNVYRFCYIVLFHILKLACILLALVSENKQMHVWEKPYCIHKLIIKIGKMYDEQLLSLIKRVLLVTIHHQTDNSSDLQFKKLLLWCLRWHG